MRKGESGWIPLISEEAGNYEQEGIQPIICEGDVIGAVLLVGTDSKKTMGEVEQKLLLSAAGFLGRQMEQ